MSLTVAVQPHPLLDAGGFVCRLDRDLSTTISPAILAQLASPDAQAISWGSGPNLNSSEAVKTAVRDLLRAGGFKPAGRSKPASEYLTGALAEGRFPTINSLVDACNVGDRTAVTTRWYRELCAAIPGCTVEDVALAR